ncbi:hypothetical protein F5Y19DRAFT_446254 [Xylariaceae sp. FL1651]|nr:hypothetical protein F5Y19DRAFT_446254 [Xylariaceae sp. FL1651]
MESFVSASSVSGPGRNQPLPPLAPFDSYSVVSGVGAGTVTSTDTNDSKPLSPWTVRYGDLGSSGTKFGPDVVDHAGLAPEYPRIDPIHSADDPGRDQHFHGFGRGHDEDRLFASEKFQRLRYCGLHSWQAASINRLLSFSRQFPCVPGGHSARDYTPLEQSDLTDPSSLANKIKRLTRSHHDSRQQVISAVYDFERIKVNEGGWLNFLKRDNWYNLDARDPKLGLEWSVDDPKVWTELSVCLELVDRILKALVNDKHVWLQTLLFGRLDYWRNVRLGAPDPATSRVLLSPRQESIFCLAKNIPSMVDFVERLDRTGWSNRLQYLLQPVRFSLMDESTGSILALHEAGLISVELQALRKLCENTITLSERCLLHFNIALSVTHEIMHAICFQRMMYEDSQANNYLAVENDLIPNLEPFVDFDGAAEIGHAYEKAVFGGQVLAYPLFGVAPISVWTISWPWQRDCHYPMDANHPMLGPGARFTTRRIPASWASKLLSASFWENAAIPRKSENSFHLNPLFTSTTASEWQSPAQTKWGAITVDRAVAAYASGVEQEMVNAWDERRNLWDELRGGWYTEAKKRWETTPWACGPEREQLTIFADFFKEKDRVDCDRAASPMVRKLPWFGDKNSFLRNLPPHDDNHWIFSAIGLLMLAACPARQPTLSDTKDVQYFKARKLRPSRQALAAGKFEPLAVEAVIERQKRESPFVERGNPLRNILTYGQSPSQFDYLEMVFDLIAYLARSQELVSGPWLCEILRVHKIIREQRLALRTQYPDDHTRHWIPQWPFQLPEYSSSSVTNHPHYEIWVKWDPEKGDWVRGV